MKPKVHYQLPHAVVYPVACGRHDSPVASRDPAAVTCAACKRTIAFKHAKPAGRPLEP